MPLYREQGGRNLCGFFSAEKYALLFLTKTPQTFLSQFSQEVHSQVNNFLSLGLKLKETTSNEHAIININKTKQWLHIKEQEQKTKYFPRNPSTEATFFTDRDASAHWAHPEDEPCNKWGLEGTDWPFMFFYVVFFQHFQDSFSPNGFPFFFSCRHGLLIGVSFVSLFRRSRHICLSLWCTAGSGLMDELLNFLCQTGKTKNKEEKRERERERGRERGWEREGEGGEERREKKMKKQTRIVQVIQQPKNFQPLAASSAASCLWAGPNLHLFGSKNNA